MSIVKFEVNWYDPKALPEESINTRTFEVDLESEDFVLDRASRFAQVKANETGNPVGLNRIDYGYKVFTKEN